VTFGSTSWGLIASALLDANAARFDEDEEEGEEEQGDN